jgi:hypothetical protein
MTLRELVGVLHGLARQHSTGHGKQLLQNPVQYAGHTVLTMQANIILYTK